MLWAEAKKDENIRRFTQDLDKLIYDMRFRVILAKEKVLSHSTPLTPSISF